MKSYLKTYFNRKTLVFINIEFTCNSKYYIGDKCNYLSMYRIGDRKSVSFPFKQNLIKNILVGEKLTVVELNSSISKSDICQIRKELNRE